MAGNYGGLIEKHIQKGDYAFVEKPLSVFDHLKQPKVVALVGLLVLVPIIVLTLPYVMPSLGADTYAVVFDAGSTGSRVHVFRFTGWGASLELQEETFEALKPGFRAYATEPKKAADSLLPLIEVAKEKVPEDQWATTPLTLRATAGLRLLPEGEEAKNAIMDEVTKLLKSTGFKVLDEYIGILGGDLEGLFGWLCVNYLLGKLGGSYEDSVAMTDMGGGSLQIAYAVSDEVAAGAPEGYIHKVESAGSNYNVYVKSYAGYGIMAGRAHILQEGADADGTHACAPEGLDGGCEGKCYGLQPTDSYKAKGRPAGASWDDCLAAAVGVLHKDKACEVEGQCGFDGFWAPPMESTLYGMSYIYERPVQSLAVEPEGEDAQVSMKPSELAAAGPAVCGTPDAAIGEKYPDSEKDHRSYLCLDVAYQYAMLTEGLGVAPDQEIEIIAKVPYNGQDVEAAWCLGDALTILLSEDAPEEIDAAKSEELGAIDNSA